MLKAYIWNPKKFTFSQNIRIVEWNIWLSNIRYFQQVFIFLYKQSTLCFLSFSSFLFTTELRQSARFWASAKELLQNKLSNMSPKSWSSEACLSLQDEHMEELGTPMDQIFNAEKPRNSADYICYYSGTSLGFLIDGCKCVMKRIFAPINCQKWWSQ